jgi:hypothetical protein
MQSQQMLQYPMLDDIQGWIRAKEEEGVCTLSTEWTMAGKTRRSNSNKFVRYHITLLLYLGAFSRACARTLFLWPFSTRYKKDVGNLLVGNFVIPGLYVNTMFLSMSHNLLEHGIRVTLCWIKHVRII